MASKSTLITIPLLGGSSLYLRILSGASGRNGRVAAETAFSWEAIADQDGLSFLTRLEVVLSDFRCHRLWTVSANRSKSPLLTAIPHTRFACDGLHCTTHPFWAEEGFSGPNRPVRIDQKRLILFSHTRCQTVPQSMFSAFRRSDSRPQGRRIKSSKSCAASKKRFNTVSCNVFPLARAYSARAA